jgi:hypothetical protein
MNNQRLDYTDFKRLKIDAALQVDVLRADFYSVTVGDDASRVKVEKVGDTLVIGRRGLDFMAIFHPRPHVVVTMPDIFELTLSGACQGKAIGFESGHPFIVKLNGASHLEIKQMKVGELKTDISGASNLAGDINISGDAQFEISGASRVELTGTSNGAGLELSGASQARLAGLTLQKASVNISGASSAQLKVSAALDIDLSGASRLEYTGSPILERVRVSGASTLKHR